MATHLSHLVDELLAGLPRAISMREAASVLGYKTSRRAREHLLQNVPEAMFQLKAPGSPWRVSRTGLRRHLLNTL